MISSGNKVRFAILGCGAISRIHTEGILNTEEASLAAVCDVSEERARQIGQLHDVPYYTSYEELLKQEDIDVINICTPSGLHPEQTIMAAKAGKHVIVEKPIAIRMDDINRMIQACQDHQVLMTSIFPRRMSPAAQYVKKFIEEGNLGKLSLCTAIVKPYRNQSYYDSAGWRGTWSMDGGGVLMNQGIHSVDLLQWLAGPVVSVYGKAEHVLRNIEVEDTAALLLQFANGAIGTIEATTTAYKQPAHQIVIHGELGTIILTEDQITTNELIDRDFVVPQFEPFKTIPDGHRLQIQDMAIAVQEGRQPIITGEDARASLAIILSAYESSNSGRIVNLQEYQ
jgi:UDP-N-acetyl-2-amino-2-deoxyglucuronate dehydrogenase